MNKFEAWFKDWKSRHPSNMQPTYHDGLMHWLRHRNNALTFYAAEAVTAQADVDWVTEELNKEKSDEPAV